MGISYWCFHDSLLSGHLVNSRLKFFKLVFFGPCGIPNMGLEADHLVSRE
jgi:hypothetical protein